MNDEHQKEDTTTDPLEQETSALLAQEQLGTLSADELIQKISQLVEQVEVPEQDLAEEEPKEAQKQESKDFRQKLLQMKLGEKIKLAMFGNAVCRSLLIFDGNKMISSLVLRNPKLALREVEEFIKNPNLAVHLIRMISEKKDWMKHYPLKWSLVKNPKTPADVSLKWMKFLHAPEIKELSKSKNIPQVLVTAAKKKLADLSKH